MQPHIRPLPPGAHMVAPGAGRPHGNLTLVTGEKLLIPHRWIQPLWATHVEPMLTHFLPENCFDFNFSGLKLIYDSFWMTIDIKMIFSNKPNCGNV